MDDIPDRCMFRILKNDKDKFKKKFMECRKACMDDIPAECMFKIASR